MTSVACVVLALGCELGPPPVDVIPCPTVLSASGSYVGFLGVPGELEPGQCIELYVGGRRRAFTRTSDDGAFYMTIPLASQSYGAPLEMRIDGARYVVRSGGPTFGRISYSAGAVPLQETNEGGRAHVRADVTASSPIRRTFTVNERPFGADVERFDRGDSPSWGVGPAPRTMTGVWMERGTLVTEHASGTGGCWWPEGGGEIIQCSNRQWSINECTFEPSTCVELRGCAVIQVEERHSGIQPHEDRSVPVGRPMGLPDAGPTADGGPIDATIM
jgi:hypothetical protein